MGCRQNQIRLDQRPSAKGLSREFKPANGFPLATLLIALQRKKALGLRRSGPDQTQK
jgi:hypothetical protein